MYSPLERSNLSNASIYYKQLKPAGTSTQTLVLIIINKSLPSLSYTAAQKMKLHNTTLILIKKESATHSLNVRYTYSNVKKYNP